MRVPAGLLSAFIFLLGDGAFAAEPTKLSGQTVPGGNVAPSEFEATSDGTRVVFRAARNTPSIFELFSVPIGGGTITNLSGTLPPNGSVASFALTPNGSRAIFLVDKDTFGTHELWSVPVDGSVNAIKISGGLVAGGDVGQYRIAPDGSRVVFRADKTTDNVQELYSVQIGGFFAVTKISGTLVAGGQVATSFQISPDSSTVVFVADKDTAGVKELYSVPINGSASPTRLSGQMQANGNIDTFRISPDSNRVVFSADRDTDGLTELYSVPIGSGIITKVSGQLVAGGGVSGSGFGINASNSRVAFLAVKDTAGMQELYSVPIAGGAQTKLSGTLVPNGDIVSLTLSTDGASVLFTGTRDSLAVIELYSAPITGGSPTKLSGPMVDGTGVAEVVATSGGRAIFRAIKDTANVTELYSVPIAGGATTKLSGPLVSGGSVAKFVVASSGNQVAFVADKEVAGRNELYLVSASGGQPLKLSGTMPASADVRTVLFSFTASGSHVLFTADKDDVGSPELYVNGTQYAALLDVDGNGSFDALTDGLLLIRYAFGLRGASLVANAIGTGATRATAQQVEDYLRSLETQTAPN